MQLKFGEVKTKNNKQMATKKKHIVFHNIDWDTDGEKVDELPKTLKVPLSEFDEDFDFESEGADYLSDKFGFCVNTFNCEKTI